MIQATGVKLLFDNYVDFDILANSFVSSEQAAFPVSNAFNFNRRSKVWRSNGYFNITEDNNVLIFREVDAGPDLTCEVEVGEYNNTSDFLLALEQGLESVGANSYTVTQNVDKKIVISSGGPVFQIRGADPLSTLISVIGFDESNGYTGALTYTADLIRINTSEWIMWDTGLSSNPNAFSMIGPRASGLKFASSSIVKLKGNPTNPVSWDSPAFETTIEFDDEVMALITEDNFHTEALRYWRLEILDVDNAYGYVEVGAFFLGKWYSPSVCAQFPFDARYNDRSTTVISEGGQSFSDLKSKYMEFGLSYQFLNKSDVEDIEFWFEKIGTGKPFFVSFDSNEQFSTKYNRRVKYCKFINPPSTQLYKPNLFTTQLSFREEL